LLIIVVNYMLIIITVIDFNRSSETRAYVGFCDFRLKEFGEDAAVKRAATDEALQRRRRETKRLLRLNHANIASFYVRFYIID